MEKVWIKHVPSISSADAPAALQTVRQGTCSNLKLSVEKKSFEFVQEGSENRWRTTQLCTEMLGLRLRPWATGGKTNVRGTTLPVFLHLSWEKGFFCQQCRVVLTILTACAKYWSTGERWRFFFFYFHLISLKLDLHHRMSLISSKRMSQRKPFMISQAGSTLRTTHVARH